MVTRNDVAKHAGVSSATVSRVINGGANVKDEMKARVEASIKALGYKPNIHAKSLRARKTYQIAYVIPDIMNPYFTEIYKGMVQAFGLKGYTCHLVEHSTIKSDDFYTAFDGAILTGSYWKTIKDDGKMPVVIQSWPTEVNREKYAFVYHKSDRVFIEAFDYLVEMGHKRIGMITREFHANYRIESYRSSHLRHGLDYDEKRSVSYQATNFHYDQGYKMMGALLEKDPEVTAVICQNDLIAMGAMTASRDKGYRVPEDISFIGNDDSVVAQYSNPKLTTIKLYKNKQGRKAAEMLLDLLDGKTVENHQFDAELIHRMSIFARNGT